MEKILNQFLSDLVVEYRKLQQYHWYVKGADFFEAHAKLEEMYDSVNEAIDAVAEAIIMEGGKPLANISQFLETAKIKETEVKEIHSDEVFSIVLKDFEYLLNSAIEIKKEADEKGSYLISALVDSYIAEYKKALWMIGSLSK